MDRPLKKWDLGVSQLMAQRGAKVSEGLGPPKGTRGFMWNQQYTGPEGTDKQ